MTRLTLSPSIFSEIEWKIRKLLSQEVVLLQNFLTSIFNDFLLKYVKHQSLQKVSKSMSHSVNQIEIFSMDIYVLVVEILISLIMRYKAWFWRVKLLEDPIPNNSRWNFFSTWYACRKQNCSWLEKPLPRYWIVNIFTCSDHCYFRTFKQILIKNRWFVIFCNDIYQCSSNFSLYKIY